MNVSLFANVYAKLDIANYWRTNPEKIISHKSLVKLEKVSSTNFSEIK